MSILVGGDTNIGMKRKTNQDSICLHPKHHFYLVADGMGGHNGGDIASQMSAKFLPKFIDSNIEKLEVPKLLHEAVKYINNKIFNHGKENKELEGMGTTISAIMFEQNVLNIANVGDSRVYMVHNNKLYQMTKDHSLVQERLNIGFYDRQGAKADPQKNVLIKTVGFEEDTTPDVYKYKISKNDLFLICSDGLHGKVADQDILFLIQKEIPNIANATQDQVNNAVASLIDRANKNGGQDNISVIIAIAK